jgi:hypothetical protein
LLKGLLSATPQKMMRLKIQITKLKKELPVYKLKLKLKLHVEEEAVDNKLDQGVRVVLKNVVFQVEQVADQVVRVVRDKTP